MRRVTRPLRLAIALASIDMAGLLAGGGAQASPITGDGQPVTTEQPSLGLTYLVRTEDPGNIADDGQIVLFAGNYAPGGYSVANGQLMSIAANPVLFNEIDTTYGGDGTTDFALPDLSGRTVVGTGQGAGLTSDVFGADTDTLNYAQLPVGYPAVLPTVSTVPEPSTVAVLLTGLVGLFCWRRRRGEYAG